jgi:hypothetical protein
MNYITKICTGLIVLIFSLCSNGCYLNCNKNPTISEYLIHHIESGNENEFTTSVLLLSHLSLNDKDIKTLDHIYTIEQDPIKKLFVLYALYQRTQEKKYEDLFISLYPIGEHQKPIWSRSRSGTDYVNVSSPLQQQLASFAIDNKEAFKKLISAWKYADGADGDSLTDQIANVYKYHPEYVLEELKKNNINFNELGIK